MKRFLTSILMFFILLQCSCGDDSINPETLEFLLNAKALSEQYATTLKSTLQETDERLISAKQKYQKAKTSVNSTLNRAKIDLAATTPMKSIMFIKAGDQTAIRDYLKYAQSAIDSTNAQSKGVVTRFITKLPSNLVNLFSAKSAAEKRILLRDKIETDLLWQDWTAL